MNGEELLKARLKRDWEQSEAAARLKVSQPYLSLLEAGKRPVTESIARRAFRVFDLLPTALPFKKSLQTSFPTNENFLSVQLAAFGYPKFSHLKRNTRKENPALILITALEKDDLGSREAEALPWLIHNFSEMNWSEIIDSVKIIDGQNRLGFLISLTHENSLLNNEGEKTGLFENLLSKLEKSRLYEEDSFRRRLMTETEKAWLEENRTAQARFWRMLTNLSYEHLKF